MFLSSKKKQIVTSPRANMALNQVINNLWQGQFARLRVEPEYVHLSFVGHRLQEPIKGDDLNALDDACWRLLERAKRLADG